MSIDYPTLQNNLSIFKKILNATGTYYFWTYDCEGLLLEADCPHETLSILFDVSGCKSYMNEYAQMHEKPLVLVSELGVMWFASFEKKENKLIRSYVVGPVRSVETSIQKARSEISHTTLPINHKTKFLNLFTRLPLSSTINFLPYTLMLDFCINEKKRNRSDIYIQRRHSSPKDTNIYNYQTSNKDYSNSWANEQILLQYIKDGNSDYKEDFERVLSTGKGIGVHTHSLLERAKLSVSSFITLCSRAAIEGGLSPETAYSIDVTYQQSLYECKTLGEAQAINHAMFEDFVKSVKKIRSYPNRSKQIQTCCDYIDMHIEEKLTLPILSNIVGYSEYYLSRKFKSEVGISVKQYINMAKIDRAKHLLRTTDLSIQEISDQLNFGSRSYFSELFSSIAGLPPAEYRDSSPSS